MVDYRPGNPDRPCGHGTRARVEGNDGKIDEINETIANETEGDAPRRARMLRAVSLASRAQTAANLTGGLKNVFGIERQSHNMDAEAEKDGGGVIVNVAKFGDTWEMPDD